MDAYARQITYNSKTKINIKYSSISKDKFLAYPKNAWRRKKSFPIESYIAPEIKVRKIIGV